MMSLIVRDVPLSAQGKVQGGLYLLQVRRARFYLFVWFSFAPARGATPSPRWDGQRQTARGLCLL